MTHVTLFSRVYMIIWPGGCAAAGTVTVITSTGCAGIVEPRATDEGCGSMAEMAIQRGCNVVTTHTGRRNPVAGRTVVHDAGMIEHCPDEGGGVMTDTAVLIG
jgi:hypothetical protein